MRLQVANKCTPYRALYNVLKFNAPVNLAEEGYDLGIRFGEPPDARLTSRTIVHNRRLLCTAPAYLARSGTPRAPADLEQHSCIILRQEDSAYGTMRLTSGRKTEIVKVRGAFSTTIPKSLSRGRSTVTAS